MSDSQIIETGSPPGKAETLDLDLIVTVATPRMKAEMFVEMHDSEMRNRSLQICRDPAVADDLWHHTVAKTLKLNKEPQTEAEWRAFFITALKKNFYTHLRDVKRHGEVSIDDKVINEDGEAMDESKYEIERSMKEHRAKMANAKADDLRQRYWVLIWGLARPFNEKERQMLDLCRQGLLIEEIAEKMGIEIESAKYRFELLKKKIRQRVRSRAALPAIQGFVCGILESKFGWSVKSRAALSTLGGVVMQKIQLMSEPSDRSLTTTEVASFFISVLRGPIRDRDGNTPEDFFMSVLQSLIRDRDWDTELAPPLISSERELSKFPGLALVDIRLQDPEAQDCRHTGKPAYGACTELLIAPLIDAFSYEFLIKTLELSDQMFEELYGATINSQERRKAMEIIRAHFASCQHCQTLDTNHKEEDSMIEACLMNGGAEPPLLNQLGRSQTWYAQPSRLEC